MATDNSPKGLRRSISAIEADLHKLLRDAPWNKNEAGVRPERTTHNEDNSTGGEPALNPQVGPSPRNAPEANQPWYKTFNGWKTRFEIAAILGGLFYAWITYQQWRDLRHNFEADQRSWIKVEYGFNAVLDPSMAVNVTLKNVGKSIALRLECDAVVQVVDAKSSPATPPKGIDMRRVRINLLFPTDSATLNSGRTPNNPDGTVNPLRPDELQRLASGDAYLAVFGTIAYQDQFGDHWTRFCGWKGYQGGPKEFHTFSCLEYNAAGDGITRWKNPDP